MNLPSPRALPLLVALTATLPRAVAAAPVPDDPEAPTIPSEPTIEPAIGEPGMLPPQPHDAAPIEPAARAAVEPATPVIVAPAPAPAQPSPRATQPPRAVDEGWARPKGELERMAPRPLGDASVYTPGQGLAWTTKDGRFALALGLGGQFLYTVHDQRPPPLGTPQTSQTLEIRRMRLFLSGNAFSPTVKYYAQLQFSPRDLGYAAGAIKQSPVFMAWMRFERFPNLVPQVGMFFIPWSRQRVTPVLKLQLVDFSLASSEFGLERDIGVDLGSKDLFRLGKLRYHLGVFLGEGTDFAKPNDFGMIYYGRLEVQALGTLDDYVEADLPRHRKPQLSLGAGYAFADDDARTKAIAGTTPSDGGTTDTHNLTADVAFKIRGLSLSGDVWFRQGHRNFGDATITDADGDTVPAPKEAARNGVGWTGQAGFLIPHAPIELAARVSGVHGLGRTSLKDLTEAGPGLSYYFAEHALKLQADFVHLWGQGGMRGDRARVQLSFQF